jgi:hypothetical protein
VNKYLLSLLLMLPFSFVIAQDETEEEVEDVVVLGVKQSLIDAIELKRSKVGVTEAITAEDIGKFPDQNLAESLARIAGITIDRSNVEGSRVNVRGLGYMFNNVTLNGRTMPTTSNQYEHGRGFDFGDISSHGVSAVEVYKSTNAALPSGGIGATINMITTKPLVTGDAASFAVRGVHDTKVVAGDDVTPEFDFLFSRENELAFGDHMLPFGFSMSGSWQERHNREIGSNEILWIPGGVGYGTMDGFSQTGEGRADDLVFTPEQVGYKSKDNERIRENFQATFQIGLGDKTTLTIDRTISTIEFKTTGRAYQQYYAGWDIDTAVVSDNGALISAAIPAGSGIRAHGNGLDNMFLYGDSVKDNVSEGANLQIDVNDNLTLTLDYHESTAEFDNNGDNVLIYSNGAWPFSGDIEDGLKHYIAADWAEQGARSMDLTSGLPVLTHEFYGTVHGGGTGAVYRDLLASDMGPHAASIAHKSSFTDMTQFQFTGSWTNNGLFGEALSSIDFGVSQYNQAFAQDTSNANHKVGNTEEGSAVTVSPAGTPDDAFTMTNIASWTGDVFTGASDLYWAEMTIEEAMYWMERGGISDGGYGAPDNWWDYGWWLAKQEWEDGCTANDAYENGEPTGWAVPTANFLFLTEVGTLAGPDELGMFVRSGNRGVLCAGDVDSDHDVHEELESIFVNFNFETDVNGMPLNAELGVRYEEITRTSVSVVNNIPVNTIWGLGAYTSSVGSNDTAIGGLKFVTTSGDFSTTVKQDYLLPSLNVSLGLNDNEVIRFGVSETNAQPSLWQVRSGFEVGDYNNWYDQPTLNRGNPDLDPYTSMNIDFAYENYYAEGSYFAINIFQKELEGYHGADNTVAPFNGVYDVFNSRTAAAGITDPNSCGSNGSAGWDAVFGDVPGQCWILIKINSSDALPSSNDDPSPWSASVLVPGGWELDNGNPVMYGVEGDDLLLFQQTTNVNRYDSKLSGVEIAIQHLFEGTPYGVQANVTMLDTDDEADPYDTGEQSALPGFGDGANISAFYEDSKFSARVSYNYRAESYAGVDQFNPLYIEARGQVDFNASYVINDNAVVFVEGLNITEEGVRLFSRYEEMLFLYQDHGPIYKAGIRYKF